MLTPESPEQTLSIAEAAIAIPPFPVYAMVVVE
jgi:hypothetical protein